MASPPAPSPDFSTSPDLTTASDQIPKVGLFPFIPCIIGFGTLGGYLLLLLLKLWWDKSRLRKKSSKESLLAEELIKVLEGITGDGNDKKQSKIDVPLRFSQDGDDKLASEVFQAEGFSSILHKLCDDIASILAIERGIIPFLIPRWKWSTKKYITSLITQEKKRSKENEKPSIDGSVVSIPVSITHIQKKIEASIADGTQLADISKIAGFEGARLAVVCKAIQKMQKSLESRWKTSIGIIRFTVGNLLTIYAFWFTDTNSLKYLASYTAGDFIASVYTQPLIDWMIPKLNEDIDHVVLMLKLRLEEETLAEELPDDIDKASRQESYLVQAWVRNYFRRFDEVKELLDVGGRGLRQRGRIFDGRFLNSS